MKIQKFVNQIYSSNTYFLFDQANKFVYIIDTEDTNNLVVSISNYYCKSIFLSHTHFDHIYGLKYFLKSDSKTQVYTSQFGCKAIEDPCINLSAYFGNDEFIYLENVNTIHEGNLKKLFTLNLITVLETHGHDWSCLTYKTSNYLFPGESYIPNTITVTTFPNSNKIEAEISLKKIKGLIYKDTIICPGHGPMYKASELD